MGMWENNPGHNESNGVFRLDVTQMGQEGTTWESLAHSYQPLSAVWVKWTVWKQPSGKILTTPGFHLHSSSALARPVSYHQATKEYGRAPGAVNVGIALT